MFRFTRIIPVIAALILAAGGVIACSSSGYGSSSTQPTPTAAQPTQSSSGGAPPAATSSAGTSVTIVDFSYAPAALTARAGQPVTLNIANNGQAPHTFTITGVVDSGTIAPGQSKTVTFTPTAAGSLQFFCTIHGATTMSGNVTVQ